MSAREKATQQRARLLRELTLLIAALEGFSWPWTTIRADMEELRRMVRADPSARPEPTPKEVRAALRRVGAALKEYRPLRRRREDRDRVTCFLSEAHMELSKYEEREEEHRRRSEQAEARAMDEKRARLRRLNG